MPLFGKKKEKTVPKEVIPPLPTIEKIMPIETPRPTEKIIPLPPKPENIEKPKEIKPEREAERPMFAPLFVKIDRYRQILNAIGYLKTSMVIIRNSLLTLNELDKAREETMKIIQEALEKTEKKISELDSELVRPSGYHELEKPEYQDVETIEATIADLKGQIEQLKSEVESMS